MADSVTILPSVIGYRFEPVNAQEAFGHFHVDGWSIRCSCRET